MAKQQCFVTIKDHTSDFRTNPKYRLLNPTMSKLGELTKNNKHWTSKQNKDNQWQKLKWSHWLV